MEAKEIFNQSRSHADSKAWNKHIAGKEYYQYHPKDKDQFRTIYVRNNPFTGKPTPHISNWVIGTPPPNIPPISPLHLSKLMTLQHEGDFF